MKESSGTLVFRQGAEGLEVLLVHPAGNYNRHKPWSIPKGIPQEGESLEEAARRETFEETAVAAGKLDYLGSICYASSKKRVHAFAAAAFQGEPRCDSREVDRAEFVPLEKALEMVHPDQRPLLERLREYLRHPEGEPS